MVFELSENQLERTLEDQGVPPKRKMMRRISNAIDHIDESRLLSFLPQLERIGDNDIA